MTATEIVQAQRVEQGSRSGLVRSWLRWGAPVLAVVSVSQVIASRYDDDAPVREAWLTDLAFVLVSSSLLGALALALALRGLGGDRRRAERTVVGLSVGAAVLAVVGWFTAAPHLFGLAALALGRETGTTQRGAGAPRAAAVVSLVVVVGLLVFTNTVLVAEL